MIFDLILFKPCLGCTGVFQTALADWAHLSTSQHISAHLSTYCDHLLYSADTFVRLLGKSQPRFVKDVDAQPAQLSLFVTIHYDSWLSFLSHLNCLIRYWQAPHVKSNNDMIVIWLHLAAGWASDDFDKAGQMYTHVQYCTVILCNFAVLYNFFMLWLHCLHCILYTAVIWNTRF